MSEPNTTQTSPQPAARRGAWKYTLVRLLLWFLRYSLYRLRAAGREHVPVRGGALLVCNHLSLIDALLLAAAATPRPVRFIMYKGR